MSWEQSANELRGFVERVERLDEEIAELRDDRKYVLAEAKSIGFDRATILKVVARRKLTPEERGEADVLLATYEEALSGWEPRVVDGGVIEGGQLLLPAPAAALPRGKDAGRLAAWLDGGMQ